MHRIYPRTASPLPDVRNRVPVREEILHLLLVRAACGLITRDRAGALLIDGAPASLATTLAVSVLLAAELVMWLPDDGGGRWAMPTSHGDSVLHVWDAAVLGYREATA